MKKKKLNVEADEVVLRYKWDSWREIFNYIYHDYLNGNITEALWNHLKGRLDLICPELLED